MKYVYGILAGFLGAAAMGSLAAGVLAVLNLYLAGHGITWPTTEYNWRFIHMSFLDLTLVGIAGLTFLMVFAIVVRYTGRNGVRR